MLQLERFEHLDAARRAGDPRQDRKVPSKRLHDPGVSDLHGDVPALVGFVIRSLPERLFHRSFRSLTF